MIELLAVTSPLLDLLLLWAVINLACVLWLTNLGECSSFDA